VPETLSHSASEQCEDVVASVLIRTVDKLIEDLHARRERWGISYYVIFEPYVDASRRSSPASPGVRLSRASPNL
jgi:hypothetical protein